jgi:hypothetical protein
MAFRRGAQVAEDEANRRKAEREAAQGPRIEYFKLSDGGSIVLRFLDDFKDWYVTAQHSFVPTKGAPDGLTEEQRKKWPSTMGAICRKDPSFEYDGCFICDSMEKPDGKKYWASNKLWARALVRESFIGTQDMADEGLIPQKKVGRIAGYLDVEEEVELTDAEGKATGEKVTRKKFVLINQGMKNFFGSLQGFGQIYESVLDRDYSVTRKGKELDTDYNIVSLEPDPNFDLTDPALWAEYEQHAKDAGIGIDELEKLLSERASDEFYAKFFDTTKTAKVRSKKGDSDDDEPQGAPAEQQTKPAESGVDPEKLQAMKDRVRASGRKATAS